MGRRLRESDAAGSMLDDAVAIDIPAPWLLRKFGQKSIPGIFPSSGLCDSFKDQQDVHPPWNRPDKAPKRGTA